MAQLRSCRCLKEAKLSVFRPHTHVFKPEIEQEGHERDIEIAGCTGGRRAGPGGAGDAGGGRGVSGPGGGYVLVSDFMHRVSRATFHKASVRTLVVHLLVELS